MYTCCASWGGSNLSKKNVDACKSNKFQVNENLMKADFNSCSKLKCI